MLNGIADIQPFVADTFVSVEKFLLGIDWKTAKRDMNAEGYSFGKILEEVEQIHGNEYTGDLMHPPLLEALGRTCSARTCTTHFVHVTRYLRH